MKKVISILRFTAGVFIASILAIVISDSMNVNCSISYGPSILSRLVVVGKICLMCTFPQVVFVGCATLIAGRRDNRAFLIFTALGILFSGVATFVYRMTNMGLFFTTFSTVTGVVLGVVLAYMGAGHIVGVWDRLFEGKKVQSQNDLGKG
jgi:hypothetical protein